MQENRPRQRFEPISCYSGKEFFCLGKMQLLSAHSSPLIRTVHTFSMLFFAALRHMPQQPNTVYRQYNE